MCRERPGWRELSGDRNGDEPVRHLMGERRHRRDGDDNHITNGANGAGHTTGHTTGRDTGRSRPAL